MKLINFLLSLSKSLGHFLLTSLLLLLQVKLWKKRESNKENQTWRIWTLTASRVFAGIFLRDIRSQSYRQVVHQKIQLQPRMPCLLLKTLSRSRSKICALLLIPQVHCSHKWSWGSGMWSQRIPEGSASAMMLTLLCWARRLGSNPHLSLAAVGGEWNAISLHQEEVVVQEIEPSCSEMSQQPHHSIITI